MIGVARIALAAGLLSVAPTVSIAESHAPEAMKSLETIVIDGAELSVVALHCAGLFHSVWDFTGEAHLGTEATEQAKSNTAKFLDDGTQMRMSETGEPEDAVRKSAVTEAFAVSTQYFNRYKANVAAGREPYATDPSWLSDLEICRNLAHQQQ